MTEHRSLHHSGIQYDFSSFIFIKNTSDARHSNCLHRLYMENVVQNFKFIEKYRIVDYAGCWNVIYVKLENKQKAKEAIDFIVRLEIPVYCGFLADLIADYGILEERLRFKELKLRRPSTVFVQPVKNHYSATEVYEKFCTYGFICYFRQHNECFEIRYRTLAEAMAADIGNNMWNTSIDFFFVEVLICVKETVLIVDTLKCVFGYFLFLKDAPPKVYNSYLERPLTFSEVSEYMGNENLNQLFLSYLHESCLHESEGLQQLISIHFQEKFECHSSAPIHPPSYSYLTTDPYNHIENDHQELVIACDPSNFSMTEVSEVVKEDSEMFYAYTPETTYFPNIHDPSFNTETFNCMTSDVSAFDSAPPHATLNQRSFQPIYYSKSLENTTKSKEIFMKKSNNIPITKNFDLDKNFKQCPKPNSKRVQNFPLCI